MITAETFDPKAYLERSFDEFERRTKGKFRDWTTSAEGRRWATKNDPLLFALVYLPAHLRGEATGERITFSDAHLAWAEHARDRWTKPVEEPGADRVAEVAPRETGKSTWWFLVLPLWAAAHGWVKFAAAFADSGSQAETHLSTFKHELETNAYLRQDYPDLVEPMRRARSTVVSDSRTLYQAKSGFAFAAKGIDAGTLGLKVGRQRPDLLILDDIEPGESNYSLFQKAKRLSTIEDVILPLNVFAHVVIVGTVTMPGSIVHELVKAARGVEVAPWIVDDGFEPHYYPAIVVEPDGRERSIWPAKWPLEYLDSIRHTRSFAKNFANDPMGADGDYWTSDDFVIGGVEGVTRTGLWIDPAVTTKASSDFTGLAVVSYSPSARKVLVKEAIPVKLPPASLRHRVLVLIETHPEIRAIFVEANQGGDTWKSILHDMPVPVYVYSATVKKEVRAASVLNHYQRGRVVHAKRLVSAEEQMVAFPGAPNDDLVDAIGAGVAFFLDRKKKKAGARSESYV